MRAKLGLLKKLKTKRTLLGVACVGVLVAGALFWVLRSDNTPQPTYTKQEPIRFSTDNPSEERPTAEFAWKGVQNDPKKIIIRSVGIDSFIQNVAVDQNNQIAVPNNVHIAGWFVDSVRPGDKGLSIIDGHVDGRNQPDAAFRTLGQVKDGDEVIVVFGDNTEKSFTVMSKQEVTTNDAAALLFSQKPDVERQLNLITCTGNFSSEQRQYDKRLIVYLRAV